MYKYLALLLSFNLYAADCELSWEANPTDEKVKWYTVYKDGEVLTRISGDFESDPVPTSYQMTCDLIGYSVSATNEAGEGQITQPVSMEAFQFIVPSIPGNPKIVVINNGTVIIN